MLRSADVVVIGGGIIGLSTAYYIAKEGMKVAVIEQFEVGSGSSGHCNGGIVVGAEPFSLLASHSNDLYKLLLNELPIDFHYSRKGSYRLVETQDDWDMMSKIVENQQKRGLDVRFVQSRELQVNEPNIAPDIFGAVEYPTDATLDPIRACWALALGIQKLASQIYSFTEVISITLDATKRQIKKVCTSRGDISTKIVVNAAGCWAPNISKSVGIELPITPRRGQILVTEAASPIVGKKLNESGGVRTQLQMNPARAEDDIAKFGIAFVMERTHDGNVLLGGSREFVGNDIRTTPEVIRAIAKRAVRFVPKIGSLNCIRSYSGLRPYTPDHHPIVSGVDEINGYYVAAGHEGDGVTLGPITGKVICEMITGQSPSEDVKHLCYSRFKSNMKKGL